MHPRLVQKRSAPDDDAPPPPPADQRKPTPKGNYRPKEKRVQLKVFGKAMHLQLQPNRDFQQRLRKMKMFMAESERDGQLKYVEEKIAPVSSHCLSFVSRFSFAVLLCSSWPVVLLSSTVVLRGRLAVLAIRPTSLVCRRQLRPLHQLDRGDLHSPAGRPAARLVCRLSQPVHGEPVASTSCTRRLHHSPRACLFACHPTQVSRASLCALAVCSCVCVCRRCLLEPDLTQFRPQAHCVRVSRARPALRRRFIGFLPGLNRLLVIYGSADPPRRSPAQDSLLSGGCLLQVQPQISLNSSEFDAAFFLFTFIQGEWEPDENQ